MTQTSFDVKEAPPVRRLTADDIASMVDRATHAIKSLDHMDTGTFWLTARIEQGIVVFSLLDYWNSDMLMKIETFQSVAEDNAAEIAATLNSWLRAGEEKRHGKTCN